MRPSPSMPAGAALATVLRSVPWAQQRAEQAERQQRIRIAAAASTLSDADAAIGEIAAQLPPDADLVLAFVPTDLDLDAAGRGLSDRYADRVVACTSDCGIGPAGFAADALVAVALQVPGGRVTSTAITGLDDLDRVWPEVEAGLCRAASGDDGRPAFAVQLVDGRSMREEELTAGLSGRLGGIPLIGASAADGGRRDGARVLVGGRFAPDAASVTVVSTPAPFRHFRLQRHLSDEPVLVVTDASPRQRFVHRLNGRPAAREYADLIGVPVDRLTPELLLDRPLVLRAGGGEWVRSPVRAEPDGSLRFLSAVEPGAVLRLARPMPAVEVLRDTLTELERDLGPMAGALLFDGALHRTAAAGTDATLDAEAAELSRLLVTHRSVGFCTAGEQFDGVHVNQTLVGIAFGGAG